MSRGEDLGLLVLHGCIGVELEGATSGIHSRERQEGGRGSVAGKFTPFVRMCGMMNRS
jgi:hypothetical protein